MKQVDKIQVSPTMLGVILTTVIALSVGAEKYGDLNGRLKIIEGKTDFQELSAQQDKISKIINEQILDAESKLKVLKDSLTEHQNTFSSKYVEVENKFNKNIEKTLAEAGKKVEKLNWSIKKSEAHKKSIIQDLHYDIDRELYRANNLIVKLSRNLKRLKKEVKKKENQLSELKKITANEIRIKEEQLSSLKRKYNKKLTDGENNSHVFSSDKPEAQLQKKRKPVAVSQHYTVQVAALRNKKKALKLYNDLQRGGFSAFIVESKNSGYIYVRVGKYKTKKEAVNIQKQMKRSFPFGRNVKNCYVKKVG